MPSVSETQAFTFSLHDAQVIAADHFGVAGTAMRLPGYEDQNFLITSPAAKYVLKIAHAGSDVVDLQLQQAALRHLEARRTDVQRLHRTRTGVSNVQVTHPQGHRHHAWMVTYLEGRTFATVRPHTPSLLQALGKTLGELDRDLTDFEHPHAGRHYVWDLRHAHELLQYLPHIGVAEDRQLVAESLDHYADHVLPALHTLRLAVIHNDANDYNILVRGAGYEARISGVLDFGDMVRTYLVCEVAIAATYVMLGKPDPVGAAVHVIRGFHQAYPLLEEELAIVYDLVLARLCVSVLSSAYHRSLAPENVYVQVSEASAWALLRHLRRASPQLAHYRFREACGYPVSPPAVRAAAWLKERAGTFAPVVQPDVRHTPPLVLDLSVANPHMGLPVSDVHAASRAFMARIRRSGAAVGVGRYNEARLVYTAQQFQHPNNEYEEYRAIHLGMDLFQEAGAPIFAPLDGTVGRLEKSKAPQDFGGWILLRHDAGGTDFYTLYGHLSHASIDALQVGAAVHRGQQIATLGAPEENGGWVPHLHFQVFGDVFDEEGVPPGVAPASQRAVWTGICPDPNIILGIPPECFPQQTLEADGISALRTRHTGANLSVSYRGPLHVVRGRGQYLYNAAGRAYLDAVNNVPHVGHCHPVVVRAAQRQQLVLNTNTRYLHATLVQYAARLAGLLPDPLEVCFFVNSGSEANDLALRLAHAHTQATGVVVLGGAYHGHLSSLIAISPYKFDGQGGEGPPPHVQMALAPDTYRGPYRGEAAAVQYAASVQEAIDKLNCPLNAFICESLLGCGGQIEFPQGYLRAVYDLVRAVGGVCIADEVQVGFGRVGTHFWGFETQGVVPDIVVMGKPIGNGHPLAAVVTTREIADSFDNGMEFFSTFGGNPVSCAVGMAVLDAIEEEQLQDNALRTGTFLRSRLEALKDYHPIVGDVRGRGLFLGVELVLDRHQRTPAPHQAAYVTNRMCERGILISTDGPWGNVLKIKPPMVFTKADARQLADTLGDILEEDFVARATGRQ